MRHQDRDRQGRSGTLRVRPATIEFWPTTGWLLRSEHVQGIQDATHDRRGIRRTQERSDVGTWSWDLYRQLFLASERRIALLNECAGSFFRVLQDVLLDDTTLVLSKLGDPAKTFNKYPNLSFA